MRSRATSKAKRVFPEPPAPVRVKSRVVASAWLTSNASSSRPTKLLLCAGRLCWGVFRVRCVLAVLKTFRFGEAKPAIFSHGAPGAGGHDVDAAHSFWHHEGVL